MLPWDSEFFSLRIGRVRGGSLTDPQAGEIAAWASAQRIDCLYFLGDPSDEATLRVAARHGFDLVDLRVALEAPLPGMRSNERRELSTRTARSEDVDTLRTIARASHRDSRFYRDGRFDSGRCDDLFATWIEKSCRGYADAVLVAEIDGLPVGYITGHRAEASRGTIGLVGVDAAARRRGCGRALVRAMANWFSQGGATQIGVVTQGCNTRALAFYQQTGFDVSRIDLWYHRWFSQSGIA
jgi:dTDP-4-amino-4,6-dideoxy-D-galactose acyltransferase